MRSGFLLERFDHARQTIVVQSAFGVVRVQLGDDFVDGQQAGLCLLRVVGELEPDRERRYLQYAYALDDPAAGCVYQPDRLTAIYAGEEPDPEWSCLNWSAHLRMAFATQVGEFWYQAAAQLQSLKQKLS